MSQSTPKSDGAFERQSFRFDFVGQDINSPLDNLPPRKALVLQNWRPEIDGTLSPRPGNGVGLQVVVGQQPVHSIRRIDDSSTGTLASIEVVGTGTVLATCATNLSSSTQRDTGYSGDPLSLSVFRPRESVKPWCYVADRLKMSKIDQAGNIKGVGLATPAAPPSAVVDTPLYKEIQGADGAGVWVASGTAGGSASGWRVDPATRSITAILYDSGNTGWACVRPSSMTNIGPGCELVCDSTGVPETVVVQEVFPASSAALIQAIVYESGVTGLCSIQTGLPLQQLRVGSMVLINGTEYVRVLSVHYSKDGLASFRCSTTINHATFESVVAVPSFRAYFTGTHAAGANLGCTTRFFTVASGIGYCDRAAAVLDLSQLPNSIPVQPDDEMHISLFVDKPELLTEVRFILDIDSTTNDFTRNYFTHVVRSNDLVPALTGLQNAINNQQVRDQRDLLEGGGPHLGGYVRSVDEFDPNFEYDPASVPTRPIPPVDRTNQTDAGGNQYTEIRFRISELLLQDSGRIGADMSRGLMDVKSIRLAVTATGNIAVRFDSWWIGGGYGPDVQDERPLIYRYRGRDSSTGVVGNFSPPMQGGVMPRRQKVTVSMTAHPSLDCDKLDIERYGGVLLGWYYVGSCDNSSPTFVDTIPDSELVYRKALSEGNTHYKLWPIIAPPNSGSSVATVGNFCTIFGFGSIDANTAPGTAIEIAGKSYIIQQLLSTTKFYLTESAGYNASAGWVVQAPLIEGQPLPILKGPYYGFHFGIGDKYNPWRLYYTNGYDPDSTQEEHYIDVEGETLQNIEYIDGHIVLFSTERAFLVEPAFTLANSGGGLWNIRPLAGSVGLWARWALCVTNDSIVYLGKDGIYELTGGSTRRISDDLRPIFPHEGSLGITALLPSFADDARGLAGPWMISSNTAKFQLNYADGEVYFDYVGQDNDRHTLVWHKRLSEKDSEGWRSYVYANGQGGYQGATHYNESGPGAHSVLMGSSEGKLHRMVRGSADGGGAFSAIIRTGCVTPVSPRISKYIGDLLVDFNTDGLAAGVSISYGLDNYSTIAGTTTYTDPTGWVQKVIDINSRAKNFGVQAQASINAAERPKLRLWELTWSERPDLSYYRANDYQLLGDGVKRVKGIWIYADTGGVSRQAYVDYTDDAGTLHTLLVTGINHATLTERYYLLDDPATVGFYMVAVRVKPDDANSWEFGGYRLDAEPAPPLSANPTDWISLEGARFVQGVIFDIDTVNANVEMTVKVDEITTQTVIRNAQNSGPVKANGRAQKAFSFDSPFITHLIRFIPNAACRIWGVKVIDEPDVELAYNWETQQTDCGYAGFKIFGDGYVTMRSTDEVNFRVWADGVPIDAVFYENTSSISRKTYRFRLPTCKAKSIRVQAFAKTIAGRVALYKKDCSLQWKPWGFEGSWQTINPLGDLHYESGAKI